LSIDQIASRTAGAIASGSPDVLTTQSRSTPDACSNCDNGKYIAGRGGVWTSYWRTPPTTPAIVSQGVDASGRPCLIRASTGSSPGQLGKQDALRQELAKDASGPGAQGTANRNLAVTGRGPRKYQVRNIGAGDQQHKRDGGKDEQQHRARAARQLLSQRNQVHRLTRVGLRILCCDSLCYGFISERA
jgi:hypothetical protein